MFLRRKCLVRNKKFIIFHLSFMNDSQKRMIDDKCQMLNNDMSLQKYKAKRKFDRTSEPRGRVERGAGDRFVIHKHSARNLHYDLRLEMDGALKSWAVPKEPPKTRGIKRLAIQVEDHPVDYLNFEGVIPEGNYGAGRVKVWDFGFYKIVEAKREVFDGDKVNKVNTVVNKVDKRMKNIVDSFRFELKGKKLKGEYALAHLKAKNWLFFKTK